MSGTFPASLAPAARSAYRAMLRSARVTFQGDPARHLAMVTVLRETFASPTLSVPPPPSAAATTSSAAASPAPVPTEILPESRRDVSVEELQKRIEEWKEAAVYLRRNIVQGVQEDEGGAWKLRVTQDTELGDNTTIRDPPKLPTIPFPNRNKRRKCGDTSA